METNPYLTTTQPLVGLTIYPPTVVCTEELIVDCYKECHDLLIVEPAVVVHGRAGKQHRDIGFFSDASEGYHYSGQLMKSQQLTQSMKALLDTVNTYFTTDYNGILVNRYLDGTKYIGAHSDDERSLANVGVFALSLGEPRLFRIRNKTTKEIVCEIQTLSGQGILMTSEFNRCNTHEIPMQRKIKDERVSFTFRKHLK